MFACCLNFLTTKLLKKAAYPTAVTRSSHIQPTALELPCLFPESVWAMLVPMTFLIAKSKGHVPILLCPDMLVVSGNTDYLLLKGLSPARRNCSSTQDAILCSLTSLSL